MFDVRMRAAQQRVYERVQEQRLQQVSPEGAYWMIDPSRKTHTPDCLAMNGHAWSWKVLSIIRPSNRHFGCQCQLLSLQIARAAAMPDSDRVRDVAPEVA
jgi:hypothetical protein